MYRLMMTMYDCLKRGNAPSINISPLYHLFLNRHEFSLANVKSLLLDLSAYQLHPTQKVLPQFVLDCQMVGFRQHH